MEQISLSLQKQPNHIRNYREPFTQRPKKVSYSQVQNASISEELTTFSMISVEEAGGKALPCILDVRNEEQVKSVVKSAVEKVATVTHYAIRIERPLNFCLCFSLAVSISW